MTTPHKTIQVGDIYEHYKRPHRYEIVAIAHDHESLAEVVVYKGLYTHPELGENALWVRPKTMFLEEVEFEGKKMQRFKRIG